MTQHGKSFRSGPQQQNQRHHLKVYGLILRKSKVQFLAFKIKFDILMHSYNSPNIVRTQFKNILPLKTAQVEHFNSELCGEPNYLRLSVILRNLNLYFFCVTTCGNEFPLNEHRELKCIPILNSEQQKA